MLIHWFLCLDVGLSAEYLFEVSFVLFFCCHSSALYFLMMSWFARLHTQITLCMCRTLLPGGFMSKVLSWFSTWLNLAWRKHLTSFFIAVPYLCNLMSSLKPNLKNQVLYRQVWTDYCCLLVTVEVEHHKQPQLGQLSRSVCLYIKSAETWWLESDRSPCSRKKEALRIKAWFMAAADLRSDFITWHLGFPTLLLT